MCSCTNESFPSHTKVKELRLKNGGDANEQRLWHGTGQTDPDIILQSESGFDERMGSADGFYGRGTQSHKTLPDGNKRTHQ